MIFLFSNSTPNRCRTHREKNLDSRVPYAHSHGYGLVSGPRQCKLAIYWFKFTRHNKTFERHIIKVTNNKTSDNSVVIFLKG